MAEQQAIVPGERQHTLDILRGLFILLALVEHFGVLGGRWFLEFQPPGRGYEVDSFTALLGFLFIPWVGHIYIHLAGFNLARRAPEELRKVLGSKLVSFLIVFLLVTAMNCFTFQEIGAKFRFDRLHAWMLALTAIALVYSYLGARGLFALTMASVFFAVTLPIQEFEVALTMKAVARYELAGFVYDGHIELFLATACIGALHGYFVFQLPSNYALLVRRVLFGISAVLSIHYIIFVAPLFEVDRGNLWANQLFLSSDLLSLVSIWGLLIFLTHCCIFLEQFGWGRRVPILSWVGEFSLLIYLIHKPIFVHIIGPFRAYLFNAHWLDYSITSFDITVYIVFTLLITLFMERSLTLRKIQYGSN